MSDARVQCMIDGEWLTVDLPGDKLVMLAAEPLELLERWEAWFQARGLDVAERGLCAVCLASVSEQGHMAGCIYALTKGFLDAT